MKNLFIFTISLVITTTSFADSTRLMAYQRCGGVEYPLKNSFLYVSNLKTAQFFVSTDASGAFVLDENQYGENLYVYLANEDEVIFPGCHSEITPTSNLEVVLHGLCPSRNCQ